MQNIRDKGIRKLRIWSSACSTGEEPYTLAMLVLNRLSQAEGRDWDIEIHGSDISEGVLSSAELEMERLPFLYYGTKKELTEQKIKPVVI